MYSDVELRTTLTSNVKYGYGLLLYEQYTYYIFVINPFFNNQLVIVIDLKKNVQLPHF